MEAKIKDFSGDDFNAVNLQAKLMDEIKERGVGETLWPLRVALSGMAASPGPFEIMEVLGKEKTLERIRHALEKL